MFSWFRSARQPARPSHRLNLEMLEARDCPAAPVITNMQVAYTGQASVVISGQVQDEAPGAVFLQFSGAIGGFTTTNSTGQFSYYVATANLGVFGCTAWDQEQLQSVKVNGLIATAAPVITDFQCVNTVDNHYTITGRVIDEQAAGLTVYLYNLPGVGTRTVTVDADGTFTLLLTMTNMETTISARTMDWWCVMSATVYTEVIPIT